MSKINYTSTEKYCMIIPAHVRKENNKKFLDQKEKN